ncbi:MAG: type VI secretion system-associated FHA domain protein TagH, partial [Psychromonas sp.]|nr:type VI secretion system-associated FHA domain protein TagH [Psychromonas sp.]
FNLPESKEFNLPETPPLETPPLISAETMPLNAAATLPLNAAAKKFNSPESKQFNSPEAPALTSAATMPLNAAAKQFDSPFTEPLHTTTKQSEQKKNIDVVSEALKTALNTHRQIPDEQLQKLVKESFKEQNIPQTNISENLSKFESRFSTKQALIKNKEFTMFMKGLGVQDLIYKKFATMGTYFELGQSMRLMFLGLSKMIKTRVAFKKEHKISRTIFKHKENNPLKFSISMDDIYQNLYAHKISSFLPAKQAIKEAFMDTLHHEEALKAGMLSAIQSVIMQLDPKIINSKNKEGNFWSNLIPGNKKAENWNAYKALHRNLKEEVKLHGNITLNEAFIKTYNEKIKSLK